MEILKKITNKIPGRKKKDELKKLEQEKENVVCLKKNKLTGKQKQVLCIATKISALIP